MIKPRLVHVSLLVFLTVSTGRASDRLISPTRQTGLLMGVVLDSKTGNAVSGALVRLNGAVAPSGARRQLLTDLDGHFVFTDLPMGAYTIVASLHGYSEGAFGRRRPAGPVQLIELAAGERLSNLKVPIWKHATIAGRVTDEIGEPIVGSLVRVFAQALVAGRWLPTPGSTVKTDDRGMFRLTGLTPADYAIAVMSTSESIPDAVYPIHYYLAAPRLEEATMVTLQIGNERTGIDLQVSRFRTARVSGTVAGPEGPVPVDLSLVPKSDDTSDLNPELAATRSDEAGRFNFPAVPPGEYLLRAVRPAERGRGGGSPAGGMRPLLWSSQTVVVGAADIPGVVVALRTGYRLSGQLDFDHGGRPPSPEAISRATAEVERADGRALEPASKSLLSFDASGRFTSAELMAGRYYIRMANPPPGWTLKQANWNGSDMSNVPVAVDRDLGGIALTLTAEPTELRGQVRRATGVSDEAASVLAFPVQPAAWIDYGSQPPRFRTVRVGRDGTYQTLGLPPGEYFVVAVSDEAAGDWQIAEVLQMLAKVAIRVRLADREQRVLDLTTVAVRR